MDSKAATEIAHIEGAIADVATVIRGLEADRDAIDIRIKEAGQRKEFWEKKLKAASAGRKPGGELKHRAPRGEARAKVLELLATSNEPLTQSEIAGAAGLSLSSVRNAVKQLTEEITVANGRYSYGGQPQLKMG